MTYEELVCLPVNSSERAQAMLDYDVRTRVTDAAYIGDEGEHRVRMMPVVAAYAIGYSLSIRDGEYCPIRPGEDYWLDTRPRGAPSAKGFANLAFYEHCLTHATLYAICPPHVTAMRGTGSTAMPDVADKVFLRNPEAA